MTDLRTSVNSRARCINDLLERICMRHMAIHEYTTQRGISTSGAFIGNAITYILRVRRDDVIFHM